MKNKSMKMIKLFSNLAIRSKSLTQLDTFPEKLKTEFCYFCRSNHLIVWLNTRVIVYSVTNKNFKLNTI